MGIEIPVFSGTSPGSPYLPVVQGNLLRESGHPYLPRTKETFDTYLLGLGVLGGYRAWAGMAFGLQPIRKENPSSPLHSTEPQRSWVHQGFPHTHPLPGRMGASPGVGGRRQEGQAGGSELLHAALGAGCLGRRRGQSSCWRFIKQSRKNWFIN